jgi:GNAT superfamily N-acetyltransferase
MIERQVEEASLNSWPARQQLLLDGWLVRLDKGYTKRANSVTPLYESMLSSVEKIELCEKLYREKSLPIVFRLPSFLPVSHELDQLLVQREYQHVDVTHVQTMELTPATVAYDTALRAVSLATWMPIFCQFKHSSLEQHQPHQEILQRIAVNPLYAVLYHGEAPVACGMGVLEHNIFGLFDIITDPDQRQQGYGTQLVQGMLAWARSHGATRAYLQVVGDNQVARHMYERLGFRDLYHYWYRVRSC